MKLIATIVFAASLGCATAAVPPAKGAIDWQAVGEHWSLHVVTTDADGDERVTRIWLANVGGEGALRTGSSRWWQNLQRDPNFAIRLQGADYPVRAEFVTEHEEKALIDDAFGEKYGWWESVMFRQERGETHENYARVRQGAAP